MIKMLRIAARARNDMKRYGKWIVKLPKRDINKVEIDQDSITIIGRDIARLLAIMMASSLR